MIDVFLIYRQKAVYKKFQTAYVFHAYDCALFSQR